MNMKILASDFDNTLFFHEGFKEKDLKAIKAFQAQGNKFGVCTGRQLEGILRPSKGVDIDYDFYITISGGTIVNHDHEIIFQRKLPYEVVKDIYNKVGIDLSIVYQGRMVINYEDRYHEKGLIRIHDLDELDAKEVEGFSFHFPAGHLKEAKACADMINRDYGRLLHAFQNNEHVDVTGAGCSKGEGLNFLKDYYHLHDDEIIGIGDSWNDLPMLEVAPTSYTFDYAPEDVQQAADHVVKGLDECINDLLNNI